MSDKRTKHFAIGIQFRDRLYSLQVKTPATANTSMEDNTEHSVFDENPVPVKYGIKGILHILFEAVVSLLTLLWGFVAIASLLGSVVSEYETVSFSFGLLIGIIVHSYLILSSVSGFILRRSLGWVLSLSCYYILTGFFLASNH